VKIFEQQLEGMVEKIKRTIGGRTIGGGSGKNGRTTGREVFF